MSDTSIRIVSLRPDKNRPLDLDLRHILAVLKPLLPHVTWRVRNLDWLGDETSEKLCELVANAGRSGYWISSEQLCIRADDVYQTIEGEFSAFTRDPDPSSLALSDISLRPIPLNNALLVIVAIDGTSFEVYSKDSEYVEQLKTRLGACEQDPRQYS